MPRIRTIKPEFPDDEKLGAVSRDARLMFVLIWTKCDDHGRFRASPLWLRNQLFPYDNLSVADVRGWVAELEAIGRLRTYEVDGETYGEVVNWRKHQRIDNAGKAMFPEPCGDSPRVSAVRRDSLLDLDLDLDLLATDATSASPPVASDEGFDDWWESYPKRNGKRGNKTRARTRWVKLTKAQREEATVALANYRAHCERFDRFPKDGERFLVETEFMEWVNVEAPDRERKPWE